MISAGDRAALPAVVLTGLFVVLLTVIINPDPSHCVYEVPGAAMVGVAAAYVITALMCTYPNLLRAVSVLAAMALAHFVTALFTGMAYSALPGSTLSGMDGMFYAVTDYLPGFMFQAAIGLLVAPVVAATLGGIEDETERVRIGQLRSLRGVESPDDALDRMCEDPAISGVALCAGHLCWGGGIWRGDPQAACERIRLLVRRSEKTSEVFELGDTRLAVDARHGHIVAVAVNDPDMDYIGHAAARSVHKFAAKRLMPVRPGYPVARPDNE